MNNKKYYTAGLLMVSLYHEFDEEEGPIRVEVEAWYRPGRPAPPCSDPDSPAFSDSGDPDELEIESVKFGPGGDLAEVKWKGNDKFEEAVLEELNKLWQVM